MTFCIYFGRRFAYTVSNIVGNTNTKKKKNKITKLQVKLGIYTSIHMTLCLSTLRKQCVRIFSRLNLIEKVEYKNELVIISYYPILIPLRICNYLQHILTKRLMDL